MSAGGLNDLESEFKRFERELATIPQPSAANAAGGQQKAPGTAFLPPQLRARQGFPSVNPVRPNQPAPAQPAVIQSAPSFSSSFRPAAPTLSKPPVLAASSSLVQPAAVVEAKPVRYGGEAAKSAKPTSSQPLPSKFTPVASSSSSSSTSKHIPKVEPPSKSATCQPANVIPLPANAPRAMQEEMTKQQGGPPAKKAALSAPGGGKAPVSAEGNRGASTSGGKQPVAAPAARPLEETVAIRRAGGGVWTDNTLYEWDANDHRVFCGDLGNEVNDDALAKVFSHFPSFLKAKVIRDKKTQKTKGFGFISFKDAADCVRAIKEFNGKYVGNRPIKLSKSTWKDRNIDVSKKKEKEKRRLGLA